MAKKDEDRSKQYQTYLPICSCGNGILIKDRKVYCRWCRAPYAEGGMIDYKDSHFKKG